MVGPIRVDTSVFLQTPDSHALSITRPDTQGRVVQGVSTKEIATTLIETRGDQGIAGMTLLENLDSVSAKFVRARVQS